MSHSFRAGIPTLMARAGYSDSEIQRQGRWRSSAFLVYCKLGRASRWKDQLTLTQRISNFYIRYNRPTRLNHNIFLDNVDSGEDGCSDIEDDCVTTVEDSLLDDSVIQTTSFPHTSRKRSRDDDHPSPVMENTHLVHGSCPQTPPASSA